MTGMIHKAATQKSDGLEFVLSDGSVDRAGDVIVQSGWELDNFRENPVALFGHSGSFVIGRWADVRVSGGKLVGRLELAARGTSQRIDELISLVEQKILRAVSVGFAPREYEPIDKQRPFAGTKFLRNELLEVSLVSVPANAAALAVAKGLKLSDETISIAFGESADGARDRAVNHGGTAKNHTLTASYRNMSTLSQRIETAQADLVAKRDKLTELTGSAEIDLDAVEALTEEVGVVERSITAMQAAEAKIGIASVPASASQPAARRPLGVVQREVSGFDLIVRAAVVRGVSHFGGRSLDQVLNDLYPAHEPTAVVAKADQTIGTTTVSGWASEIVQTAYAGFLEALTPFSIYPALRARGIGLSFDGAGTVSIPSRTAGGAGGGFVGEGSPIRVGRITTAAVTMTPFKMGVIIPFSRELIKRSTPAIEALVRRAILEDTATILDGIMLDATAASSSRPAGLLNGISATATGYGGGDYQAVIEDFKALLAPFYAANAADNITVIMNPAQALAMSMMAGPGNTGFGWSSNITSRLNILESTSATANRLVAIRNSDFATAMGDTPEFDVSEQATVHMEDTTPLEIVAGAGPTTADPVRSFFQTATVGVRMLMDVSWRMRRTGMVRWIDGTSW